jgi:hypothetical protein
VVKINEENLMTEPIRMVVCPILCVLCFSAANTYADPAKGWEKRWLSGAFYCEGGNAADFNNDGKLDIVAGPFIHEGPEFSLRREIMPPRAFEPLGYSTNFFAFPYDFNNDNWMDVLIIGFPGQDASWFENPGKSESEEPRHWKRHLVFDKVNNESPTFVNIVGDETPELVFCTNVPGYATWDKSDPAKPWTFHPMSKKGKLQRFTHGMGVGDVNGDGRMDYMEKSGWWEQPASLEGDPEWKKHDVEFAKAGGAQMYAYDVDGDGDNDVITSLAAHACGFAWYENVKQSDEISFKQHLILSPNPDEKIDGVQFSEPHALDLVDMDGDGVKDIVTGKRFWSHGPVGGVQSNFPAVLYWFKLARNNGQVKFIPMEVDTDSGVGTQIVAKDVNGDGKPDIIVANKKGTILLLQK